jgi:phage terminase large subunit-like protein
VLLWLFPCAHDNDAVDALLRMWLPARALERHPNARVYQAWRTAGLLTVTPDDAVDYRAVGAQVLQDARTFDVRALNVDTLFQGAQLASELLEGGINVTTMRQGHLSFAAPMVEFERMLLGRRIHHGNHAALAWQAGNVAVVADAAGNLKIRRDKRREKVDAIVSLVMALDARTHHPESAWSGEIVCI